MIHSNTSLSGFPFQAAPYVCTSGPILPSNPTGLQANSAHQPLLVLFKHHQLAPFWSPFPSLSWTHSQLLQPLFNPTAPTLVQAFIYLSLENCKGFLNTGLSPVITIMPQAIHSCPTCRINTQCLYSILSGSCHNQLGGIIFHFSGYISLSYGLLSSAFQPIRTTDPKRASQLDGGKGGTTLGSY